MSRKEASDGTKVESVQKSRGRGRRLQSRIQRCGVTTSGIESGQRLPRFEVGNHGNWRRLCIDFVGVAAAAIADIAATGILLHTGRIAATVTQIKDGARQEQSTNRVCRLSPLDEYLPGARNVLRQTVAVGQHVSEVQRRKRIFEWHHASEGEVGVEGGVGVSPSADENLQLERSKTLGWVGGGSGDIGVCSSKFAQINVRGRSLHKQLVQAVLQLRGGRSYGRATGC
ncbi:hypothetical protein CAOG_009326 [Capsaspora owczarzaki ATCC 30864]|uniref:Uncharacterized protein n=1 Tax=Capsaspora owczarzaki (strain ATCC 30864) TaxID=595528 RepID=A0A0D2X0J2_CAPO3|nr:hypothetical protein CAOG_009326 [Capsaspora owczarzaki ATCC 30864]